MDVSDGRITVGGVGNDSIHFPMRRSIGTVCGKWGEGGEFPTRHYLLDYGVSHGKFVCAHSAVVTLRHFGRARPVPNDVQLRGVEVHLVGRSRERIFGWSVRGTIPRWGRREQFGAVKVYAEWLNKGRIRHFRYPKGG